MIPAFSGRSGPPCLSERSPWRGGVYAAAFAALPVFAYLWPLGLSVLVPLLSLLLLSLWTRPQGTWPIVALLLALAVWAAGTLAWSPALPGVRADDPESQLGLKLLLQVPVYGFFAAAAGRVSGRAARRAMIILAAGLLVLGAVLVLEGATSAWIYRQLVAATGEPMRPDLAERNIGKGQFLLALLAWPALVFLYRERRALVVVLAGMLLLCVAVLNEFAPIAGFAAGGVAFVLVARAGALGARVLGALLGLQLLLSPWIVKAAVAAGLLEGLAAGAPQSWGQRLAVWTFVDARILERPWLGWGLEASRTFAPVPLHPHNAGLQIWLELGVVGALLFALVWLRVFESIARVAARDRIGAAACAGAAGAYFTIGGLSFGVWQEWWLATAALVAAVCTVLVVARRREALAHPQSRLRQELLTPL